jgi:pyrroline-5-carboxylate reductase
MLKLGFIGAGNLASSLIKGLSQGDVDYEIRVFDLVKEKVDSLVSLYKVKGVSQAEAVQESDIVVLAVKPKDVASLLKDLSGYNLSGKLIIAVAAGISLKVYEKALPGIGIVRVMPNTSSSVLHSVSGLARGRYVSDEQAANTERIFSALGKYLWIDDSKMNALTAVSGSGPAYFYLLTELMSEAGSRLGLDKEEAEFLARETLIGAGKMLEASGISPQELREAVTSPNGTTQAAVDCFREEGLPGVIYKGMLACRHRAEEMEREYS